MVDLTGSDLIVVGSGFFGATIAERCATELGLKVTVIERRAHIGGNAWSELDADTGIEIHNYGSHIFHTNSEAVWTYLNRFSAFSSYRHRVIVRHRERFFSMPINLGTMSSLFGRFLSPSEAKAIIEEEVRREKITNPANLEEKAISLIGRSMYDAFVKNYTQKQWQTDPRDLPAEIITRLPVRMTFDDFYFSDRYEGIPLTGYGEMLRRMLDHKTVSVHINMDFFSAPPAIPAGTTVLFTGPIDRYFEYKHGLLGWRTLDFEKEIVNVADFQGASVVNYPDSDIPFTRIHEFRHLHPERKYRNDKTVIFREFSRFASSHDEPYYPINAPGDRNKYDAYVAMAQAEPNVLFGGRLATYKYLDIHQAVGAALKMFDNIIAPAVREGRAIKR